MNLAFLLLFNALLALESPPPQIIVSGPTIVKGNSITTSLVGGTATFLTFYTSSSQGNTATPVVNNVTAAAGDLLVYAVSTNGATGAVALSSSTQGTLTVCPAFAGYVARQYASLSCVYPATAVSNVTDTVTLSHAPGTGSQIAIVRISVTGDPSHTAFAIDASADFTKVVASPFTGSSGTTTGTNVIAVHLGVAWNSNGGTPDNVTSVNSPCSTNSVFRTDETGAGVCVDNTCAAPTWASSAATTRWHTADVCWSFNPTVNTSMAREDFSTCTGGVAPTVGCLTASFFGYPGFSNGLITGDEPAYFTVNNPASAITVCTPPDWQQNSNPRFTWGGSTYSTPTNHFGLCEDLTASSGTANYIVLSLPFGQQTGQEQAVSMVTAFFEYDNNGGSITSTTSVSPLSLVGGNCHGLVFQVTAGSATLAKGGSTSGSPLAISNRQVVQIALMCNNAGDDLMSIYNAAGNTDLADFATHPGGAGNSTTLPVGDTNASTNVTTGHPRIILWDINVCNSGGQCAAVKFPQLE